MDKINQPNTPKKLSVVLNNYWPKSYMKSKQAGHMTETLDANVVTSCILMSNLSSRDGRSLCVLINLAKLRHSTQKLLLSHAKRQLSGIIRADEKQGEKPNSSPSSSLGGRTKVRWRLKRGIMGAQRPAAVPRCSRVKLMARRGVGGLQSPAAGRENAHALLPTDPRSRRPRTWWCRGGGVGGGGGGVCLYLQLMFRC